MPSAARLTAPPLVLALHEKLLASDSATAVLREMFGDPVAIIRRPVTAVAPDARTLTLLSANDPDGVLHRAVTLSAAGREVSDADLWYVPSRLLPGMAEKLLTTALPFGAIVAPLRPNRETISSRISDRSDRYALHHCAILRNGNGEPIALVEEHYRMHPFAT